MMVNDQISVKQGLVLIEIRVAEYVRLGLVKGAPQVQIKNVRKGA